MTVGLHAFAEDAERAGRLALALGVPLRLIGCHTFPDAETLVTVLGADRVVLVYRSLDRPNDKLFPLIQACDAWRRTGVERLVLVAPYLAYMRQDAVFAAGQCLSRDVLGRLLGDRFDRIVTVEPHLHRTGDLFEVFGVETTALAAAADLAEALVELLAGARNLIVVGPDAESQAWTERLAARLEAPAVTFQKIRHGDAHVDLALDEAVDVTGRPVVLVDDICSSGATLVGAIERLKHRGAARIVVAVVHALFTDETERRLRAAGADDILSSESCPHPTNRVPLTALLAQALVQELAR